MVPHKHGNTVYTQGTTVMELLLLPPSPDSVQLEYEIKWIIRAFFSSSHNGKKEEDGVV